MKNEALPRDAAAVVAAAGWAWARNVDGEDVYVRPHKCGLWPVIFLDDLNLQTSLSVSRKYSSLVVETSRDNCQIWVQTGRPLEVTNRKAVQTALAGFIGGDKGSTSGDHFGRAVGFKNRKEKRDNFIVRIAAATNGNALQAAPYLAFPSPIPIEPRQGGSVLNGVSSASQPHHHATDQQTGTGKDGDSEAEFGWALHFLRNGGDLDAGVQRLAERAFHRKKRSTFPAAEKYARLTFQKAQNLI